MQTTKEQLKEEILRKIKIYADLSVQKTYIPGESFIEPSGKYFDHEELCLATEAVLDGWWTEGRFAEQFSRELAQFFHVKHVHLVNSGSSANLLAFLALTSHLLPKERRINPGDEVITVAAGFPTTVNPIIVAGCTPVFVDVNISTGNINTHLLQEAKTEKTKAVMIAHTLGNPFNLNEITAFCKQHNLWLVEDCCDALGAMYKNKHVGTFGDLATVSFYPAHQITTGEGGAVITNSTLLARIVASLRDWGRDCWCKPGVSNTCGKRFSWQSGNLPLGYDHKYVYSHLGYNLKLTDMQAAIGLAQIKKLPSFIETRRQNFKLLYDIFKPYEEHLYLPTCESEAQPSWFGFLITMKEHGKYTQKDFVHYLNAHKIGTRTLFAGNILKQPYFINQKINYRVSGNLTNTDMLMNNACWIGVHPKITEEVIAYEKNIIDEFFRL